jgi:hypothetical protein
MYATNLLKIFKRYSSFYESRDSSVRIVINNLFSSLIRNADVLSSERSNGRGAHSVSHTMGTGAIHPEIK